MDCVLVVEQRDDTVDKVLVIQILSDVDTNRWVHKFPGAKLHPANFPAAYYVAADILVLAMHCSVYFWHVQSVAEQLARTYNLTTPQHHVAYCCCHHHHCYCYCDDGHSFRLSKMHVYP